ncbi:MAG: EAL domain-containing protein, partial [Acidimicrobiia bacterium]|nr:EAL domain-containing protein [Acidimicrobiia bacterium]
SFIDRLDSSEGDGPIVASTIISLAHTLGLKTIAEGVTTVTQLAELYRMGCDAVQGFYFSPPLEPEAFETYLARRIESDAERHQSRTDAATPPSGG